MKLVYPIHQSAMTLYHCPYVLNFTKSDIGVIEGSLKLKLYVTYGLQ